MFDLNYQYEPIDWRSGLPDTVDPKSLLAEPVEEWFENAPDGEGTSPPEGCLAIESGLFVRDDDYLVANDEALCASFFAERFLEFKLSKNWDDSEAFAAEFALVKRFGILNGPFRNVLLDTVVLLHNSKGHDVISMTTKELVEERNASGYWSCVACAIPFLDLELDSVIELLKRILALARDGKYGWEIYGAVARLAQHQPELGRTFLDQLVGNPVHPIRCLLADILVGLSQNDLPSHYEIAKQWVAAQDTLLIEKGCLAIGAFDYSSENGTARLDDAIETLIAIESNSSEEVQVALVSAYGRLSPLDSRCIKAIEQLSRSTSSKVKSRISFELHHQSRKYSNEDWFRRILNNLAEPSDTEVASLDSLDFVLAEIAKEDADYAIDYLEKWLLNHEYDVYDFRTPITKTFQSTLVAVSQARPNSFQYFVTRWFLADDKRLHRAASDLVQELSVRNISGTPIRLELQTDLLLDRKFLDLRFVARKIMGYVTEPHMLSSLIFSMVKSNQNTDDVMKLVVWAFRVYVGYNYRMASREWLDEKLNNGTETEKSVATICIKALDDYYNPLDELPRIKEFSPPTLRVREYDKQMRRLMRAHQDEAKSQSVLSQLFTEVNLKYGRRAAFQIEGKTQVSELTSFENAVELPRGDLIDPVGMRHRRLIWRHEERANLCD